MSYPCAQMHQLLLTKKAEASHQPMGTPPLFCPLNATFTIPRMGATLKKAYADEEIPVST